MPHKPNAKRMQSTQLNWWKEKLGAYSLANITPTVLAEYRDKLADGITSRKASRSNATVNRYLAALSHLFTVAVKEWGWLDENPLAKVTKLKEPRGRVRFLSEQERKALMKACKESTNPYMYLVLVLCLSTGARKMEILNLRWGDIDFSRGVFTLHETKNGERRVLPIVGLALDLLKEHASKRATNTELVFPGTNPNKPMDLRTPWETVIKKAELNDFRFHDLRHSAASYLAMNGASLAEIAEILGHKTLQMVKRYSHLSEAHTAKVVTKMNEQIFSEIKE
jgi:integrase